MENKVFLDDLPRKNNSDIDWGRSEGCVFNCIYNKKDYVVEILEYKKSKYSVVLKWGDICRCIETSKVKNCKLGGLFKNITKDFKIEVGTIFKDDKRFLEITGRELVETPNGSKIKHYKYKCNNCNYNEGLIREYSLLDGQGCSCCAGKVVVSGINDFYTLKPDLVKFFKDKDISKKITLGTHKEIACVS